MQRSDKHASPDGESEPDAYELAMNALFGALVSFFHAVELAWWVVRG